MGDVSDAVKDIQEIAGAGSGAGEAIIAIELAEAAMSTIANLSGGLQAIQNLLDNNDTAKLQNSVDAILSKFLELFKLLSAVAEQNLNIEVTTLLGQSRSQLRPILQSNPPDFDGTRGDMLTFSSNVVEAFKQDGDFWKRLFIEDAVYKDSWVGDALAPPVQGALVFDYVQMMPAFLESIKNRLCVLRAAFEDFPQHEGVPDELRGLANALQLFHDRVEDGILPERPPIDNITESGALYDTVNGHTTSKWDDLGRTFGAVEIYSGVAIVSVYPRDRYPSLSTHATDDVKDARNNGEQFPVFLTKHTLASTSRMMRLYSSIGLASVWRQILYLRTLAGDPVTLRNRVSGLNSWSLVEAVRFMRENLATGGVFISLPPDNNLGAFAGLLGFSRPVSIRQMLETNT
jgi:hypothetical protein